MTNGEVTDRLRGLWERCAARYDRDTGFYDLLLLGEPLMGVLQASGQVLEVAIGTGRNLPFYPRGIQLTGIDFSPAMLEIARGRAAELGVDVTLIQADAQHLPFADHRFDTVVCTLASAASLTPLQQSTRCTACFAWWSASSGRACRKPHRGESRPTNT